MKKIYYYLMLFLGFNLNAQVINFPDANFKTRLLQSATNNYIAKNLAGIYFKIDSNNNGEIEVNEANQVSFLNVAGANISSLDGVSNFVNLNYINCNSNIISSLNLNNFINLEYVLCSSNILTSLNLSSLLNLKYVECNNNQISSLNLGANTNMTYLSCNSNNLSSLDATQLAGLQQLYCANNTLQTLNVTGLQSLYILSCGANLLNNINLTGLYLHQFNCSSNQLSSLDLSAMNIGILTCSNNLFTSLNLSQMTNLSVLYCNNNQISELNLEGCLNLQTLNCSNNLISTLNLNSLAPPSGCDEGCPATINVSNNNLLYFFIKSGRTDLNINFIGNPNIQYICTNESLISTLQNKVSTYGYTSCQVNSYCSFNPGGTFYTIQGNNKFDNNSNGCDALDINFPNMKFNITNGFASGSTISNNSGVYSIPVEGGSHTITPQFENPSYFTVSPTSASVTFPSTTSPFIQNFCIAPNGVHHDLEIVIIPIGVARPGFDAIYKIKYKNKGNQNENAAINFNYNDAILDYVSSSLSPTTQATGMLSWNIGTLAPFQSGEILVTLNVNSPTDTPPVNGGDILSYTANISGPNTDETTLDNSFTLNQTVVNSFDPNDKTCLEGTIITPSQVGKDVHYMIRFENTGTTNAQNIVVKDMIDTTKFDITTLQITDTSHPCVTRVTNPNKVEFIFENIQLPFDDANNDGYVVFKIKTKPTLVLGNTFSNTASIYFDYNFPIITNTTTTTVSNVLANQDFDFVDYFSISPNPAKDILTIQAKESIEVYSINIYNTLGQLVLLIPNAKDISTIDVSSLKTGNYFIKMLSDKGVSSTKFIKE